MPTITMSTEEYTFPTRFHEVASNIYSSLPNSVEVAAFILAHLDENKVNHFLRVYKNTTQFNRFEKVHNLWPYYYTEQDDAISGTGVDMLIYMLDAASRDTALKARSQKLGKGKV